MIEKHLNPDWYRIRYNLAALHANWAAKLADGSEANREEARAYRGQAHAQATELAEAALEQLVERSGKADPSLLTLLEQEVLPSALILYSGSAPDPEREESFYATRMPGNEKQLLEDLRKGLSPEHAFDYVAAAPHPTPRTLYNLACAATQSGDAETGKRLLQRALETGSEAERRQMVQRAAGDPSLSPLRNEGGLDFSDEIVRRAGAAQRRVDDLLESLRIIREFGGSAEPEEREENAPQAEDEEENGPEVTGAQ